MALNRITARTAIENMEEMDDDSPPFTEAECEDIIWAIFEAIK